MPVVVPSKGLVASVLIVGFVGEGGACAPGGTV